MRIRTFMTLSSGAALGAGAMYLLDPDHGEHRRRDARRHAVRSARSGALHAAADARRRTEEMVLAAVDGYQRSREEISAAGQVSDLAARRHAS